MTNFLARRRGIIAFIKVSNIRLRSFGFSTIADDTTARSGYTAVNDEMQKKTVGSYYNVEECGPRLFMEENGSLLDKCNVEVVDHDAWQVSSGLAQAWWESSRTGSPYEDSTDNAVGNRTNDDTDVDDVEDMRIRGKLFYKLEKDSKEFEEYHYEFRGKGSKKNKNEMKKKDSGNQKREEEKTVPKPISLVEKESVIAKFPKKLLETNNFCAGKRIRTPTFNQLTGPYHEPFCLDIFISKGSVRACIVHRASSKVVAVAHSISKDIKFDIGSTRDAKACATVGRLLAQRAVEDDIHNAIYTPRKGEKLEGKLLLVLQTVIDNGVNVKLKIKQRKPKKAGHKLSSYT